MMYLRLLGAGFVFTLGVEIALGLCMALGEVFGKRGRRR